MSFLASFLPLDPSAGLQPFQIQPCDGRVVIGRGALTGISKNIVSRNLGAVWVTPAGEALFEKNGSSAVYLRKGAGEKDEEELRTGSVTVLSNGCVLALAPDKSCVFEVHVSAEGEEAEEEGHRSPDVLMKGISAVGATLSFPQHEPTPESQKQSGGLRNPGDGATPQTPFQSLLSVLDVDDSDDGPVEELYTPVAAKRDHVLSKKRKAPPASSPKEAFVISSSSESEEEFIAVSSSSSEDDFVASRAPAAPSRGGRGGRGRGLLRAGAGLGRPAARNSRVVLDEDDFGGGTSADSASDMEDGTPLQRLAKAALPPLAPNPAEVIFRNIGTVQFSVDCEGARLAMVHLGEVVRAPKADGVDPLVAHSYLRALMGPFHVNRCYAVAMGKHRRLGAGSPVRKLSVGLLKFIFSFLSKAGQGAGHATPAGIASFNSIAITPSFGGTVHESLHSKRIRAVLNSLFVSYSTLPIDRPQLIALPSDAPTDASTQHALRIRTVEMVHALLMLTGKSRVQCQPYEPEPPKNPTLTTLEIEANQGKLTADTNPSRFALYERLHGQRSKMMAEWSAKALPCIVGNLKVVDATERALTFESTLQIHQKTFNFTVPTYRTNLVRNLLVRLFGSMRFLAPAPSHPFARPPKRAGPDFAFEWDPVISVAKRAPLGVPPSESYKLDRSMWMWLDDVARDGGVSAARLLYCSNAEVREMFSEDYVIPEPPVPRPFRFHVTGMLSAVEACPTGSQVTLHDEAYVASLAGNMAVVPRPPKSGDREERRRAKEARRNQRLKAYLAAYMTGGAGHPDESSDEDDEEDEEPRNYGSAASAYGPPAVSVPVPVVSSSPLLQPADRPGSEGWESLAVYGLVHSLRDYQKKTTKWLLSQERRRWGMTGDSWFPVPTSAGDFVYLSPFGHLLETRPSVVRGGFLCDEMGLGKTVELIALILLNPRRRSHVDRDFVTPIKPMLNPTGKMDLSGALDFTAEVGVQPQGRRRRRKKFDTPVDEFGVPVTPALTEGAFVEDTEEVVTALLAPEDGVKSRSAATLVVVAATLVTQWAMELKKHAPTLMVITYHGPSRKSVRERDLLRADVVLTSYPMIRYMTNVMEAIDWHRIILDESQCVKAPNTVAAKLCQRLSSKHRWCVTGTPCSSDGIHYLCGQLAALRASPYCLPAIFNSRCITPFRRGRTSNDGFGFFLRFWMKNCVRNTKAIVAEEMTLPQRNISVLMLEDMGRDELSLYDNISKRITARFNTLIRAGHVMKRYATVMSLLGLLRQAADHPANLTLAQYGDKLSEEASDDAALKRSLTSVVDDLVKARNEVLFRTRKPGQRFEALNKDDIMDRLSAYVQQECPLCLDVLERPAVTPCLHMFCMECIRTVAVGEKPVCPLCRSVINDPTQIMEFGCISSGGEGDELGTGSAGFVPLPAMRGEVGDLTTLTDPSGFRFQVSAKLAEAYNRLKEAEGVKLTFLKSQLKKVFRSNLDEKVIVFTQFSSMFDRILRMLKKEGMPYSHIRGDMSRPQRKAALEKFADDPTVRTFVLTLRSAAIGLTLTTANHVVFVEPCMNLGQEQQAIGRVHRMGQTRQVHVVTLIAKGTIEENILKWNENAATAMSSSAPAGPGDVDDGDIDERHKAKRMEDIVSLFQSLESAASPTAPPVTAASSSGARAPAASSGPVMGINGPASSAKV